MQDYVTFSVASAQGADIIVTSSLDGFYGLSDPYYGSTSAQMVFSFGGSFGYYGGENAAGAMTGYNGPVLGDFTSYSFSNETPTGFDFSRRAPRHRRGTRADERRGSTSTAPIRRAASATPPGSASTCRTG